MVVVKVAIAFTSSVRVSWESIEITQYSLMKYSVRNVGHQFQAAAVARCDCKDYACHLH